MDYRRLIETFRAFTLTDDEDEAATALPEYGKVDFSLAGEGIFPHIDRFTGLGRINLEDADLGRIRLVGALSRVLEQVGLPFTSFSMRTLRSEARIENGNIHFPDLVLGGPTARIRAEGDFDIASQAIEMDLRVYLFTADNNPLVSVVGLIFRPFAHALELELSGSIEDPEWRFKRNPFNIPRAQDSPNDEATPP